MATPAAPPPGRNEPCHCGSSKKYKQCCLEKDEATARKAREDARAAAAAAAPAGDAAEAADDEPSRGHRRHGRDAGHFGVTNQRGFQKTSGAPRKVGGG